MPIRRSLLTAAACVFACGFAVSARQHSSATATTSTQQGQPPRPSNPNGWDLPADADQQKSPLTVDANVIASGKALFNKKCERCHGPGGKGDGPDADPDAMQDMDLTVARRAARNPDGVVFFKVWNGRKKPKMPAFKDELTKDQVWQVVAYAQTLRSSQ